MEFSRVADSHLGGQTRDTMLQLSSSTWKQWCTDRICRNGQAACFLRLWRAGWRLGNSASPEKSALSDRLTQHLAGWGMFLDCASKRQRLRRCGESSFSLRVPASTLQRPCSRASANKQRAQGAALDTAAVGPLASASLYL